MGMTRSGLFIPFVLVEAWQFVAAGYSSLQLEAPGVDLHRAAWVPNVLAGELVTILPIGFVLCLWGARSGRILGALCAGVSGVVALVAAVMLGTDLTGTAVLFALLAVPGLILVVSSFRIRVAAPADIPPVL
jgi:hypothetical protein